MSRSIFRHAIVVCLQAGLLLGLLGACGCSNSDKQSQVTGATVSGVVRYQGKPVTGGAIRLWGDSKDGNNSAAGVINGDGAYEVVNAPLGRCKVVVNTEAVKHDRSALLQRIPEKDREQLPGARQASPKKYMPIDRQYTDARRTPIEITVEKGRHTHDIDLP